MFFKIYIPQEIEDYQNLIRVKLYVISNIRYGVKCCKTAAFISHVVEDLNQEQSSFKSERAAFVKNVR